MGAALESPKAVNGRANENGIGRAVGPAGCPQAWDELYSVCAQVWDSGGSREQGRGRWVASGSASSPGLGPFSTPAQPGPRQASLGRAQGTSRPRRRLTASTWGHPAVRRCPALPAPWSPHTPGVRVLDTRAGGAASFQAHWALGQPGLCVWVFFYVYFTIIIFEFF